MISRQSYLKNGGITIGGKLESGVTDDIIVGVKAQVKINLAEGVAKEAAKVERDLLDYFK